MNPLIVLLFIAVFIYCCISWFIPQFLAWLFKRRYKVELKVGRIVIPKFILKDITIVKNGFSIYIEEVSVHSSLWNSEVTKLISVVIRDVRINKDVLSGPSTRLPPSPSSSLDFRDVRLPAWVAVFAQFLSVHVHNLSLMVLRAEAGRGGEGWLWHGTARDMRLGGEGGACLRLSACVAEARAKLLRPDPRRLQVRLAELSCGLSFEVALLADAPLAVEKIQCSISSPTASINEGIYEFIKEKRSGSRRTPSPSAPMPPAPTVKPGADLFGRIAPIIPKNFSLKISGTILNGVRENSRTDFRSSLHSLQVNARFSASQTSGWEEGELRAEVSHSRLPQVYLAFQMDQLKINNDKEKLFFLNKMKLDAKLEKEVLNLYLILNTLTLSYDHDDVYKWFSTYFPARDLDLVSDSLPVVGVLDLSENSSVVASGSWLEEACTGCVVQGCAELWGASLAWRRGPVAATLACNGLKVKLDQLAELRGAPYIWAPARLALGMRHWSAELLIDSAWLRTAAGDTPLKKHHSRGTAFFLGVALVKWGSHGALGAKVEAMLDCLRAEWGPAAARAVLLAVRCLRDYRPVRPARPTRPVAASPVPPTPPVTLSATLTNVNVFAFDDADLCVMARIDAVSIERSSIRAGLVVSGFKMSDTVLPDGPFVCQRAEEMTTAFAYAKLARCELEGGGAAYRLLESAEVRWSPGLHLKCVRVVRDWQRFIADARDALRLRSENSKQPTRPWRVSLEGFAAIRLVLSERHDLLFTFDDISFGKDHDGFSLSWSRCRLAVDEAEIFTVEGVGLTRIHDSAKIREERKNAESFVLDFNKTWSVSIASFRAVFPYEHQFADAIQEEFVSITKWVKAVHEYKKKDFTEDSPLPGDLYIEVEEFVLEMTDDPFEVRLRDNYELLEDEYEESLKRKAMLDAKVAELSKPHLFLPAGKVEELYAGLGRCNAQIYVQRSRQLARGAAGRALLTCRLTRLRVLALADPSLHGTTRCITLLRRLDPDTPWPEEGLHFSTLWARWTVGSCAEWRLQLRDFPQPLLSTAALQLWGVLMGAEQLPPPRARRSTVVEQGAPWGPREVERSMTSLKFYHDLNCEMERFTYAFGPCWEPVVAQCNLSWERVMRGSRDPSAPLAWWDKARLMLHGRLTLCVRRLALLLHASLDPYNTTEEMELAWSDLALDWTDAKMVFRGDLNVFVRTASKYDDCRLLHLPDLRLTLKLSWLCLADPHDHHAVVQCAPDKVPEYSSNQEHDSYRAFRSQGVAAHLSLETRPTDEVACPAVLLYGSTLRWFESLKNILSGATRPTRRGAVFNDRRPRKPQLSRHFRTARLSLALHRFQACYWMSFAMQRGVEVCGRRVTCGAQHALHLAAARDGLRRRPRASWPPLYINCELNDAEVWLKSALPDETEREAERESERPERSAATGQPVEKCYCLSVGKVSYGREGALGGVPPAAPAEAPPAHRLVVHDLRGAWTKTNRDVAFALFDTYMRNKQLKRNLSTEALKAFRAEDSSPGGRVEATPPTPPAAPQPSGGQTQALLAQLVAEAEHKSVVFSDDLSESSAQPPPHVAAQDEPSVCNWLIALVNPQVVLRGCETRGYVVLCAARAEVRQKLRRARSAWAGSLQSMQYYATVSARDNDRLHENIQWVCVEEIEERGARAISALPDVPRLVGSGHSAGGVLGSTVGPSEDRAHAPQLQRIVSRCTCEFYYVGYEDAGGVGEDGNGSAWGEPEPPCDSFTLMHHDLDVCTNSLQYAMLLDVVNNLVLYVEPQRKRALERMARMRFRLQLHSVPDPRRPIQLLQTQVRALVARLRRLERETYLAQRDSSLDLRDLRRQVLACKERLVKDGEELHAMVACYQEARYRAPQPTARPVAAVRVNEICFKRAQWRLTDADGQLGIADLVLANFQYTKNTKSDDSVEHLLELGYVRMTNLLPNEAYTEVLVPSEVRTHMPVARQRVLRAFCRERPPVGGISVKEHFEINVVPITIGLTKKFFNTMLKFCFPERDPETIDAEGGQDEEDGSSSSLRQERGTTKKLKSKKLAKDTNFYVKIEQKDDVEKMKERAEKNKLFIYIKIPEVPVRVSYKGNKEKNLEDLRDISLVIPTLEYHNVTWTWLDLLLAMKSDSRRVILSQAIRQKLQLHRRGAAGRQEDTARPEEDKARMLLGERHAGESKAQKKKGSRF